MCVHVCIYMDNTQIYAYIWKLMFFLYTETSPLCHIMVLSYSSHSFALDSGLDAIAAIHGLPPATEAAALVRGTQLATEAAAV